MTIPEDHIAWTFDGPSPDCSTPLYYKGNFYVLADRKGGVITCLWIGESTEFIWHIKVIRTRKLCKS